MTKKEFISKIARGKKDIVQKFFSLLAKLKIDYCLIGGLAVNAYVEPVVSLDLDIVVAVDGLKLLLKSASRIFTVKKFPHSVNLISADSDLRIQIQTDHRYQVFIRTASIREVMGYKIKVASLKDVLQGKVWAYLDEERRASKRQKDLADIFRIIETYPDLKLILPKAIKKLIEGRREKNN